MDFLPQGMESYLIYLCKRILDWRGTSSCRRDALLKVMRLCADDMLDELEGRRCRREALRGSTVLMSGETCFTDNYCRASYG